MIYSPSAHTRLYLYMSTLAFNHAYVTHTTTPQLNMNSNDFGSTQPVFQKLKNNIQRLKVERDEVNSELSIDRNDLNAIESSMAQLGRQIDERMTFIREKQRQLMELEKAINETQKSYDIIVETTRKLSNALETEALHLRGMSKK